MQEESFVEISPSYLSEETLVENFLNSLNFPKNDPIKRINKLIALKEQKAEELGVPYQFLGTEEAEIVQKISLAMKHFESRLVICAKDGRKHMPLLPLGETDFLPTRKLFLNLFPYKIVEPTFEKIRWKTIKT
jgi:hypothetical protein